MINPIQLSLNKSEYELESVMYNDENISIFNEAVFSKGKETVKPILDDLKQIKEELNNQLQEQDESRLIFKNNKDKIKSFDPEKFWKNELFKQLEDDLRKIFGFRTVFVYPTIESYNSKNKSFKDPFFNAYIVPYERYPIDGLITDKGFYDKNHSMILEIDFGLEIMKLLNPDELLSILLHELGHSIDPALVDINYTETNILVKYILDRKKDLTNEEKQYLKKSSFDAIVGIAFLLGMTLKSSISAILNFIFGKFLRIEKFQRDRWINKIRNYIKNDPEIFDRKNSTEAFADNFARMYGFGGPLMSALRKMRTRTLHKFDRIGNEFKRQSAIAEMIMDTLKDEHKTHIHRIRNLINEYKEDLNDATINPKIKKQISEDLALVEEVLYEYLNNFGKLQNSINRVINEELENITLKQYIDKKKSK